MQLALKRRKIAVGTKSAASQRNVALVSSALVAGNWETYETVSRTRSLTRESVAKRVLDLSLSTLMLCLSVPAVVLITLLIKLEDGGPIFYRQERWGRDGTRFKALKFRTMVTNSDRDYGIKPAGENDHRVTRVGRVLRAMGLDELPQIFNILLGHMSFVGPRSLAVGEKVQDDAGRVIDYEDVPGFRERLHVRPGLTGIATIYIPKDSSPYRKFRYDLFYIRRQSFWLDIRLIALSFSISFRGKWESRCKKI
jgi:lipopolysaccharide/colanic/teichoic acid biosynthesis glycosyltransferase